MQTQWGSKLSEKNQTLNSAYISLGSNINKQKNILSAYNLIAESQTIESISSIYETPPVGSQENSDTFLNAIIKVKTPLSEQDLNRKVLKKIESKLGRQRSTDKNAPRKIDLDIIIFNEKTIDPEIQTLAHLAIPLAEIKPDHKPIASKLKTPSIEKRNDVSFST